MDFASIDNDVIHADRLGEVSGVSLINGEPAELLDAHWLFANYVGATAQAIEQLSCRIPGWDPWMQNMLRPLVEAAGYRVIDDAEEQEADVVIASIGEEFAEGEGEKTIWLRTEPEARKQRENSIYRYDRAGLLMALKSVAGRAMNTLLLVVTIGGERVALPAAAVESVVELDTLIRPRAAPHIAGLSALRSRVLTVVDCMRSLELGATDCSDGIREAAVVELDGHHYALIVDLVEDVVDAQSDPMPVRAAMEAGWARVSQGMIETEIGPLLLVDVAALVAAPRRGPQLKFFVTLSV